MRVAEHGTSPTSVAGKCTVSNVIVPLDGSARSLVAIPLACRLVDICGATPHVIYAGEQGDSGETIARFGVGWQQLPGAVIHETTGPPAESILRLSRELSGSLIVMCTHTRDNRQPHCFGSVTESVLAGDPQQILLLAPEHDSQKFKLKRILLAHDGTPTSACAVGPATELAVRAGADVLAVHVAAPRTAAPEQAGSLPAPRYVDQPQYEWPSWANEFGARLLALGMPESALKFKVMVAGGQAGSELAQFARTNDVDMVVLANSGDWKHCRHSIARVVILRSDCPVMLVSHQDQLGDKK